MYQNLHLSFRAVSPQYAKGDPQMDKGMQKTGRACLDELQVDDEGGVTRQDGARIGGHQLWVQQPEVPQLRRKVGM